MPDIAARLRTTLSEFRRRRVFRVAAVYLLVGWLLVQVADATFEPLGLPTWAPRLLIVLLGAGLRPGARARMDLRHPSARHRAHARVARADHGQRRNARAPRDRSTAAATRGASAAGCVRRDPAVLRHVSEAGDQDYFCDGLAEEILNALAKVRGLHVASRTASFRFRDGTATPADIGRQLHVAAIMEGSVRKAGDRVRVTAQLVDASNGYHLWSENFDRNLADIFAIQEEIARNVVNAVRPTLQAPVAFDLQKRAPRDMRAYEFYLRGRQASARMTEITMKQAPSMFRRAIELDPDYAQAYAGLSDSLVRADALAHGESRQRRAGRSEDRRAPRAASWTRTSPKRTSPRATR